MRPLFSRKVLNSTQYSLEKVVHKQVIKTDVLLTTNMCNFLISKFRKKLKNRLFFKPVTITIISNLTLQ